MKCERVRPGCFAHLFIRSTKVVSGTGDVLGECDGRVVAGLDDHAHQQRIGRRTRRLTSANMRSPSVRQAFSLISVVELGALPSWIDGRSRRQPSLGDAGQLDAFVGELAGKHVLAGVVDEHVSPDRQIRGGGHGIDGEGGCAGSEQQHEGQQESQSDGQRKQIDTKSRRKTGADSARRRTAAGLLRRANASVDDLRGRPG